MGKISRIMMWAAAVLAGLALAGGFYRMVYDNRQIAEAHGWPSVQGRIEISEMLEETRTRRGGRTYVAYFIPRVEFRYAVGGMTYLNDDIWLSGTGSFSHEEEAARVVRAYPVGSPVQVFYAPDDPRRSTLRREIDRGPPFELLGGLFWLGVAWWFRRKVRRAAMHVGAPT